MQPPPAGNGYLYFGKDPYHIRFFKKAAEGEKHPDTSLTAGANIRSRDIAVCKKSYLPFSFADVCTDGGHFLQNFIPENTISDIQNAADIVDVISDAVMLKKSGRDFLGLCPFHSEKTPSFSVSPEKQIFYCFGCGTGGNVFNFLMKYENISFPEAAGILAGRYGIDIPATNISPEQKKHLNEREEIYDINRQTLQFFRSSLLKDPAGNHARSYLEQRGITAEISEDFQLGYALPSWDGLLRYFSARSISPGLLEKAGLVIPRKKGSGYYDRFRDRIIFPIRDERNRVVAFAGRVMDDSLPKYLNSPETPVFSKSRILYGLSAARQAAREQGELYITEGYFDVISLHRQGIRNSAATMGTNLSGEHLKVLKGCTSRIILVFDSDQAGLRAAGRSIPLFRQNNTDARILVLPDGDDPDSFVCKSGPDAFLKHAEKAQTIMQFLMEEAVRKHGLSVEGKVGIIEEMQGPLAEITDPLAASLYVRELAERIGADEAVVREKLRSTKPRPGTSPGPSHPRPPQDAPARPANFRIERKIIAMMLQFPEIISEIEEKNLLGQFESPDLRMAGEIILSVQQNAGNARADASPAKQENSISGIMHRIQDKETRRMIASLAMEEELWNREGCRSLLAQFERGKKSRTPALLQEIEKARKENNQALLTELLHKKQNQARERLATT